MAFRNEDSNEKYSAAIRKCCTVLKSYSWVTDAYILDFFTEDLWEKLPHSWQEVLNSTDFTEVGLWLDYTQAPRYFRPWPLSLLALRVVVQSISLPRRKDHFLHSEANKITNDASIGNVEFPCDSHHLLSSTDCCFQQTSGSSCGCQVLHSYRTGSEWRRINQAFQKHVTPKKIHEIFKMAQVACQCAMDTNVTCIVDVGSGIGHLARLLCYGHGCSVCCIESQEALTSRARELDEVMENTLSKILSEEQMRSLPRPSHITSHIGPDLEMSDFVQMVSQAFQQVKLLGSMHPSSTDFGIVGLHPCGDLAPYLLQLFVDCPDARFLCIAGCCYMKLTPVTGFPLCAKAVDHDAESPWLSGFKLSYEAREMACHAIEVYSHHLLYRNASSLKIHCYRATLENIIVKNWPNLRRRGLKSIKYSDHLQFSEYARRALSALNLIAPEKDIVSQETNECLERWQQVVYFYSLRLMFAPLVETLILIDRYLFLSLKGITCRINPEFDPELSPRNHLLIALKPTSN